jgi:DNA-binding NarL/FixJ family response regulator
VSIRVFLVDDHEVFRDGLRAVLEGQPGIAVIGEAGDGRTAIDGVTALRPDVVLMDLGLPGISGREATAAITASAPECRVLVLSMLDDRSSVQGAVHAGARGYLVKTAGLADIVRGIQATAAGQRLFDEAAGIHVLGPDGGSVTEPGPALTMRERQVLRLLGESATTGQIAARLGISTKTVRNHLSALYLKLGVTDRTQAALLARDRAVGAP